MPYIPDELYNKLKNQEKVAELLEKYFGTDVVDNPNLEEDFFKELKEVDEPKVYDYLKTNNW